LRCDYLVLRNAANVATTATLTRLESKKALDALRDEAANSLNAVCGLLDRGVLTQEVIDQANRAVSLWVDALPVASRQSSDRPTGRGEYSEIAEAAAATVIDQPRSKKASSWEEPASRAFSLASTASISTVVLVVAHAGNWFNPARNF
jgi:hypothetical protein